MPAAASAFAITDCAFGEEVSSLSESRLLLTLPSPVLWSDAAGAASAAASSCAVGAGSAETGDAEDDAGVVETGDDDRRGVDDVLAAGSSEGMPAAFKALATIASSAGVEAALLPVSAAWR